MAAHAGGRARPGRGGALTDLPLLDMQLHTMCNKVAAGGRNRARPTIQEPSHDDVHPRRRLRPPNLT